MTTLRQPASRLDVSGRRRAQAHVGTVLVRRRLIELLREGSDRQVTVISAPAGYGKTTLAVQWLHLLWAEGTTVAWLGLHRDDNDPLRFLSRLLGAVGQVLRSDGDELCDLAQLVEQDAEGTSTYAMSVLLDRIGRHGGRFVLTVDDWHLVDDPSVHRALGRLLDFAPPNLLLVLTSRTRPRLPLGRLRVRRQLTEIDADKLRLDAAEARAFLVDRTGLELGEGDVARLSAATGGSAAALQLVALSLRDGAAPGELIREMSARNGAVEEYLAEHVLGSLPPQDVDVLLATCVCDRFCSDLVAALSGRTDGRAALEGIERRGLFLRPLDTERTWFRYHHLFAEHLRRRLSRDRADWAPQLHARACLWFAGQGLVSEAVSHALAAGDVATATDLVERSAMPLVQRGRVVSLLRLVDQLPAGATDERPGLLIAVAWANCLLQRMPAAQTALDRLRQVLPAGDRHEHAHDEADVVQACLDVFCDRTDRAEDLVRRSLDRAACHRPWAVAVAADIQTFCDVQATRFAAARERQRWARPFHDRADGPFPGVYGRCLSGMAALAQLDLAAAEEQLQEALALARTGAGPRSPEARLAGALLGELSYERGELEQAERLLETSRQLGADNGPVEVLIDRYALLARLRARRGAVTEAVELLGDGARVAERRGLIRLQAAVTAERVTLLIGARRLPEARRAALELPDGAGCPGGVGVAVDQLRTGSLAAVLSAEGDSDRAAALLEGLVAELHGRGQWRAELAATVQLAGVHERSGRWCAAEHALAAALTVAVPAGLRQKVLDGGPDVSAVLVRLLDQARADVWPEGLDPVPAGLIAALSTAPAGPRTRQERAADLTGREIVVLRMLDSGRSNQQIAQALRVTVNTVKWYLKSINVKLGATNRTEAVSLARRRGLVP